MFRSTEEEEEAGEQSMQGTYVLTLFRGRRAGVR
jgi:hypothetical protein